MSEPSLLRQLLDRQEIMAVMAAYTRCADMNQPERQAEVFVQDCQVKYHLTDWIVGRGALIEALRMALARYSKTSHHLGNIEIDFEGPDSAAAQSAVIAWHRRHDGSEWTLYGRYIDRWTRTSRAGGSPNASSGRQAPSAATTASYRRSAAYPAR